MSLLREVLPCSTGDELLQRLADATGQTVGYERPLVGTWRVASPGANGPTDELDGSALASLSDIDTILLLDTARQLDAAAMGEKLAAMAELAAGAGHEVNNPLATVISRAKRLLAGESDPARRRELAQIAAEAERGRDMIGDLMLFARPPQPHRRPVDVPNVLDDVRREFARELAERELLVDVAIENDGPDTSTHADADPTQLAIVWSELLRNALRFAPQGSTIRAAVSAATPGVMLQMSLTDDGPGLTDEQRRHAFDPFYSGRQAGRGLGFGLAKCWRIVRQHGGHIALANDPTRVVIDWPSASGDAPPIG